VQLVGVVRDIDFFFSQQFPVIAFGAAIVHINHVGHNDAVRSLFGIIKCNFRGSKDTAQSGSIGPGFAGFLILVQGLVKNTPSADISGRGQHL